MTPLVVSESQLYRLRICAGATAKGGYPPPNYYYRMGGGYPPSSKKPIAYWGGISPPRHGSGPVLLGGDIPPQPNFSNYYRIQAQSQLRTDSFNKYFLNFLFQYVGGDIPPQPSLLLGGYPPSAVLLGGISSLSTKVATATTAGGDIPPLGFGSDFQYKSGVPPVHS